MNLKTLTAALLVAVAAGCNTSADEQTVLHIGKYKLTKSDLQEQIKRDKYKSVNTGPVLENRLLEEGSILAFALDHRYDTVSKLNKLLHYASRAYAAKVDGFVWNKKVKPKLQLTEEDIKDAYLKRSQEYVMETIIVRDKSTLNRYYKSASDFNLLSVKASPEQGIRSFTMPARFPYYPFSNYSNSLEHIKVGDIVGPLQTPDGYVIARVAATKPVAQKTYEQEKEEVKHAMLFALTQKYMMDNQKQIFDQANPEIDNAAVIEIAQKFDTQKKTWLGANPARVLMHYNFEGKRMPYRVSDLMELVANEPVIFGSLREPKDVKNLLLSTVIEQYMLLQAQQMNMQEDKEYLTFKKHHQEDIFLEHYKQTCIYPKLSVTPAELEDYYRKNNQRFNAFERATVAVYKFNDNPKAFRGQMLVMRKMKHTAEGLNGSKDSNSLTLPEQTTVDIQLNAPNNNPELVKTILKLAPGQVSSPVKVNEEFWVVQLMAKKGTSIIPYQYVKDEIQQMIRSQKIAQLNTQAMAALKARYPVQKNELKEALPSTVINSNNPLQQQQALSSSTTN
jgi:hypothetical protein